MPKTSGEKHKLTCDVVISRYTHKHVGIIIIMKKNTIIEKGRIGGQSLSGQTLSIGIVKVPTPLAKYVSCMQNRQTVHCCRNRGVQPHTTYLPITSYRLPKFS